MRGHGPEEILLKRCQDEDSVDAERRAAADAHYAAIEKAEAEARAEKEKDRVRMQNISALKIQRIRAWRISRSCDDTMCFEKRYDAEHTCYLPR